MCRCWTLPACFASLGERIRIEHNDATTQESRQLLIIGRYACCSEASLLAAWVREDSTDVGGS